jgi:hypothetical protein
MKKLISVIALISAIFAFAVRQSFAYDFRLTNDNVIWANQQNILSAYELLQIPVQKINNKLARVSLDLALAIPLSVVGHEFGGHANACPVPATVGFSFLSAETYCDFNPVSATYNSDGTTNIIYPNTKVEKWYREGNSPTLVYEAGLNFQTGLAELATQESLKSDKLPIDISILRIVNGFELLRYTIISASPQTNSFSEKANQGYDPADYVLSITQDPDKESSLYANMMAAGLWQAAGLIPDVVNLVSYLSAEEIKTPSYWLEPLGLLTPYGVEYQLAFFAKNPNLEIKTGIGKGFNGVSNLVRLSARVNGIRITERIKVSPYVEAYKNLTYGFVGGLETSFKLFRNVGIGIGTEIKPTKGFSPEFQFVNPGSRSYIDITLNF